MCKGFGSSLTGRALLWYMNLPNSFSSSFAQLNDVFVEQFASSRKIEKLSDDHYLIVQRPDEPLRSYIGRFNKENVSITNCNFDTVVSAFWKGLRRGLGLYKEVKKCPCRTIEDIMVKAWEQIKWEEDESYSHRRSPLTSSVRKEACRPHREDRRRTDLYPRVDREQEHSKRKCTLEGDKLRDQHT